MVIPNLLQREEVPGKRDGYTGEIPSVVDVFVPGVAFPVQQLHAADVIPGGVLKGPASALAYVLVTLGPLSALLTPRATW